MLALYSRKFERYAMGFRFASSHTQPYTSQCQGPNLCCNGYVWLCLLARCAFQALLLSSQDERVPCLRSCLSSDNKTYSRFGHVCKAATCSEGQFRSLRIPAQCPQQTPSKKISQWIQRLVRHLQAVERLWPHPRSCCLCFDDAY